VRVRRETALCTAGILAFTAFLVMMASRSSVQLDDWYEVDWLRHHDYSVAELLRFARYNYANYNPRVGETLLLIINGPALVHAILTPALQLLLVVAVFVHVRGAWPRRTYRDLGLLVVLQALIWLAIPIPGPIYFYRPFTANYLFATTLQLALFLPYRRALASSEVLASAPARPWLAPIFLVWGAVAGMANEHTGPIAIITAIAWCAWAWRHGRLRAWMVLGAIGLVIGYAMLLLAPGQAVRYAGVARGAHPFRTLLGRGLGGNFKFVADYVVEIGPALVLVGTTTLVALRRGAAIFTRRTATEIVLALGAALTIVVTAFASPIVEDRLFFAPCIATVIGLGLAVGVSFAEPRARALLVATSALVVLVHVAGFVVVYRGVAARSDERLAAIASGQGTVTVEPADVWFRDHWEFGDDFQNLYMRELVAHHFYTVDGIELAHAPFWAQPNPPERAAIALTYDPPVAGDPLAGTSLASHVPVQWAWAVRELRESWSRLTGIAGHALRAIDVTIQPGTELPGARPIYLLRWRKGRFTRIDAHPRTDPLGWQYAYVDHGDLPITPIETYVDACGTVARATSTVVDGELRIPLRPRCVGNHTVYLCDASECWLAWRYW
jgi:Family of unknown function (DUF6056)